MTDDPKPRILEAAWEQIAELKQRAERAEARVAELIAEVARLTDEMIEDSAAHVSVVARVDELTALVHTMWIHSGYPDCGRDQMTTPQKALYDSIAHSAEQPAPRRECERIQCNNCGRFGDDEDLHGQACGLEFPGGRKCHGMMLRDRQTAQRAGGDSEVERVALAIKRAIPIPTPLSLRDVEDMARAAIAAMAKTGRGVGGEDGDLPKAIAWARRLYEDGDRLWAASGHSALGRLLAAIERRA